MALLRAVAAVQAAKEKLQGDERTGAAILERALEEPTRIIAPFLAPTPPSALSIGAFAMAIVRRHPED